MSGNPAMVSALDSGSMPPTPHSSHLDKSPGWSTGLCSWAWHVTFTVPIFTKVYKWVLANLMFQCLRRVILFSGSKRFSRLYYKPLSKLTSPAFAGLPRWQSGYELMTSQIRFLHFSQVVIFWNGLYRYVYFSDCQCCDRCDQLLNWVFIKNQFIKSAAFAQVLIIFSWQLVLLDS